MRASVGASASVSARVSVSASASASVAVYQGALDDHFPELADKAPINIVAIAIVGGADGVQHIIPNDMDLGKR